MFHLSNHRKTYRDGDMDCFCVLQRSIFWEMQYPGKTVENVAASVLPWA